jgi:hypothetical protein
VQQYSGGWQELKLLQTASHQQLIIQEQQTLETRHHWLEQGRNYGPIALRALYSGF